MISLGHQKDDYLKIRTGELDYLMEVTTQIMNEYHQCNFSKNFWWVLLHTHVLSFYNLIHFLQHDESIFKKIIFGIDNSKWFDAEVSKNINSIFGNNLINHNKIKITFQPQSLISGDNYIDFLNPSQKDKISYQSFLDLLNKFFRKSIHILGIDPPSKKAKRVFVSSSSNPNTIFFDKYLISSLPKEFHFNAIKKVVVLSKFLSLKKPTIRTYMGGELSLFTRIFISYCYSNNRYKEFKIIPHGFGVNTGDQSFVHMSLNKEPLNLYGDWLKIENYAVNYKQFDILIIAPVKAPIIVDRIDLDMQKKFLKEYSNILHEISNIDGLRVKIRFKNLNEPFSCNEEGLFQKETESFEESFNKYKLVLLSYAGTILGKCLMNNIDYVCLNIPYLSMISKESFSKVSSLPNVHKSSKNLIGQVRQIFSNSSYEK